MNKKILKSLVSIFIATLMLTSSFAVFAADGIITPWNTTFDFNGWNNKLDWDGSKTGINWNMWPSTYTNAAAYPGCTVVGRDSYIDSDGNKVYDSVTKTAGDKYIYFKPNTTITDNGDGTTTSTTTSTRPGYVYFNYVSSTSFKTMNGGLSYGKVVYEFDIRIDEITAAYHDGGTVTFYTSNNGARNSLLTMYLKHDNAEKNSWYISYYTKGSTGLIPNYSSPKAFTCGDWIRFKITIDVPNKVYYLSYKPVSTVAGSGSESKNYGPLALSDSSSGIPAGTNITIDIPKYCATSIDNMSVTKETFVVDETKTAIAADGTNVNASVTIGNCVYADANTQFGDTIKTTSPVAILALYNKADGSLIDVDFDTVTYENHNPSGDSAKETSFKAKPDYQTVSLSLAQPNVEYEAKVYVWDSMSGMVPYVETYPTVAAE